MQGGCKLLTQLIRCAWCLAREIAGSNNAAKIPIPATTTTSSIRVSARFKPEFASTGWLGRLIKRFADLSQLPLLFFTDDHPVVEIAIHPYFLNQFLCRCCSNESSASTFSASTLLNKK